MDITFLNLAAGLAILIVANVFLGSINALFTQEFQPIKLLKGCLKGIIVVGIAAIVSYAGSLNPDIIAIEIDGQRLNVASAVNLAVLSGYYFYGKQVVDKIFDLLKGKNAVTETEQK